MIRDIMYSLRIRQWSKNVVVFAALIFSGHAIELSYLLKSFSAYIIFCFTAGSIYIFNDVIDLEYDRNHPIKQQRPIASGHINTTTAIIISVVIGTLSLLMSFLVDLSFGFVILGYITLQIIYTFFLKKIVIVDVFAISFSFILRLIAGGVVIHVAISNWILICTMLLALFLALSKRRHEITLLENDADLHRVILKEYSPQLLDQMIGVVTSATLVAYMIFTLSPETTSKFGNMVITVPFVLYGIFRYLYLVHMKHQGGQPEEILLSDIPLQVNIILYGLVSLGIIYL